jgi:hypothetical protein
MIDKLSFGITKAIGPLATSKTDLSKRCCNEMVGAKTLSGQTASNKKEVAPSKLNFKFFAHPDTHKTHMLG